MEHTSGPMPPNELAEETVDALREALERYARHPAETSPGLRAALHELAREARLLGMPPEQLLVLLKRVWHELPDIANAADHIEQTRILQAVVTMCIREYFAD
jgi:hypothetical protein